LTFLPLLGDLCDQVIINVVGKNNNHFWVQFKRTKCVATFICHVLLRWNPKTNLYLSMLCFNRFLYFKTSNILNCHFSFGYISPILSSFLTFILIEYNKNETVIVKSAHGIQFFWVHKFYLNNTCISILLSGY
jgi:hypothetical protein